MINLKAALKKWLIMILKNRIAAPVPYPH